MMKEEEEARHGVSRTAFNLTAGGSGSILLLAALERGADVSKH